MIAATPSFLLENPDLVTPIAPWCTRLENLELGILLLAQPWLAGGGLRRAELQAQLERLAADLPLGPVYFQRVSRAAALLEERGQLRVMGGGRAKRYKTTPPGFAALILNLQVLRADPTLDGSEFELKRALVALWNLVAARMDAAGEVEESQGLGGFLEDVERLRVWGQPVLTEEVVADGLDLMRLIQTQRERLAEAEAGARRRLEAGALPGRLLGTEPAGLAEAMAVVRVVAAGAATRLAGEATLLRYRAYAAYLDGLATLYARELPVVDRHAARRALAGR